MLQNSDLQAKRRLFLHRNRIVRMWYGVYFFITCLFNRNFMKIAQEIVELHGHRIIRLSVTHIYGTVEFYVTNYPTGNCQLSSLAYAANLFTSLQTNEQRDEVIMKISEHSMRCILIDVKRIYEDKFEAYFKDKVITKSQYKSSNGSLMTIYIIRIKE